MSEKSYRIKANVGEDKVIKTSLTQDIDFLEVLSLKLNQKDTYKLHVSNYGIIVGRVLANEAFGVPNARVSVFIKLTDEDMDISEITNIYPYKTINTTDGENRRYNLLPDDSTDTCYRIVGTFPNKRLVLDNDTEIEIYEKYWKYTTITNQSGDYMIFGVPTGNQTVHIDIDLSDIGILSQKPRDFFYKGYNKEQFDSAEQFREGTNLDNLTQLISQNIAVHVYPFFGDENLDNIAITRCDFKVPYKFEPTCVFIGSIVSDKPGQHIGHSCGPTRFVGYNRSMMTGEGTIEMIRKTPNGMVEEFPIKGNRLIDGDGTWCYQIPMNLDYIGTDEFGNIIPVQDSTKGIPTRTSVRFRISLQETVTLTSTEHVAKYLVPNVHELHPQENMPMMVKGNTYNDCYIFGSATPKEYFRDLLWNKVYSVKNFIPRFEHRSSMEHFIGRAEKSYMGVRSVNAEHNNNVFPFNNARFHLRFTYRILCLLMTFVVSIIGYYNKLITEVICWRLDISFKILGKRVRLDFGRPLKFLSKWIKCIGLKGEMFFEERADTYYFPKCDKDCGSVLQSEGLKVNKSKDDLIDIVQQTLALEYEIVNLDFYNDWINGVLYLPLWFWKKRAKKKYLFGLFRKKAKNTFCSCDKAFGKLSLSQPCATTYNNGFQPIDVGDDSNRKRYKPTSIRDLKFGVIKEYTVKTDKDDVNVYYYAPGVPYDANYLWNGGPTHYTQLFATDIILLGSLNSCDLDNLPKTFDSLPSSTVNLPFIATFESDESGDGVVTGLDWGHDGDSQSIKYRKGLLMDLECWNVYTRFKSCVNVGRLSELHVSLDMDLKNEDNTELPIWADGVITEKELVDHETRAKFASMNHNGLTNLVKNPTTNYDTYKFHYMYPINFDGHLNAVKYNYVNGLSEWVNHNMYSFDDTYDSNYAMYRLGEGKDTSSLGRHKKHFYIGSEAAFRFPLYNNSFYFYFGLHDGKTAIDKFNTLFNTTCVKKNKYEFTIEYESKAGKWCYNTANTTSDFGTIDIEFNGLSDIFSYALYNEFNEELIREIDVKSPNLKFGYAIVGGGGGYVVTSGGYKKDGRLRYFKNGEIVTNVFNEPIYLENGVYYLEVTNANGMKVTERLNMIQNVLSPNIEEIKLGRKYIQNASKIEDICNSLDYYGEIKIKSFIVDGEEAFITEMTPYFTDGRTHYYNINGEIIYPDDNGNVTYNGTTYQENIDENNNYYVQISSTVSYSATTFEQPKEASCKVKLTDGSEIYLILEPENDETQDISCFACYGVGKVPSIELEPLGTVRNVVEEMAIYTLSFNIWKPGDYVLTSNQICQNVMNDNVSVNTISVENGENFKAFLNGVPFQVINNTNLQTTTHANWVKLEDPTIYEFKSTKMEDAEFWDEMIDITIVSQNTESNGTVQYVSEDSKIAILKTQYQYMAKICNMLYLTNNTEGGQITISTQGGKEPILIRNVHPDFTLLTETNSASNRFVMENKNTIEAPFNYPYLMADAQGNVSVNRDVYTMGDDVGNYCAVFTNNGGIVSLVNGGQITDDTLAVEKLPQLADALNKYSIVQTTPLLNLDSNIKNSYLKTMFVNKKLRVDNGLLWAPIHCQYDVDSNPMWKYGKWEFDLYNTMTMAYDENYNIIGNGLSYGVSMGEHIISAREIQSNIHNNDYFNFSKTPSGGYDYYEIDTTIGIFSKQGLLSGATKLSATTLDELAIVVKDEFANTILNVSFIDDEPIQMKYVLYHDIINSSGLTQDINVYLTNNLTANSNKALYKAVLSVDGEETDVRSLLDLTRSKQNLLLPYGGVEYNFDASNCQLNEELIINRVTENEEEKYEFKSIVENAGNLKQNVSTSEEIQIQSCAINYIPKNGYEKEYIVWDGVKVDVGTSLIKGETCNAIDYMWYEKHYAYLGNVFKNDKSLHKSKSAGTYNVYSTEDGLSGRSYFTQMILPCDAFYTMISACTYATSDDSNHYYYYKDQIVQKYLNKYGYYEEVWLHYNGNPTDSATDNFWISIWDNMEKYEKQGCTYFFQSYHTHQYKWDYIAWEFKFNGVTRPEINEEVEDRFKIIFLVVEKNTYRRFFQDDYRIWDRTEHHWIHQYKDNEWKIKLPVLQVMKWGRVCTKYSVTITSGNVENYNLQVKSGSTYTSITSIKNNSNYYYNELTKHWYEIVIVAEQPQYNKLYYRLCIGDKTFDEVKDDEIYNGEITTRCEIIDIDLTNGWDNPSSITAYIYGVTTATQGTVNHLVMKKFSCSKNDIVNKVIKIDGIKYNFLQYTSMTTLIPSRINDFSCKIVTAYDESVFVSSNAPFLFRSVEEYYDVGEFINEEKQLYGGKQKNTNLIKDNIQGLNNEYLINCNTYENIGYAKGISGGENINNFLKEIGNCPVIGEMYCYYDRLLCGTIKSNYDFIWNDGYGEHDVFPATLRSASIYGRYLACPIITMNSDGWYNDQIKLSGGWNEFIHLTNNSIIPLQTADSAFRKSIKENLQENHNILQNINNLMISGQSLEQQIIYGNSEEQNYSLYVLQTNRHSNYITKKTKMLTCGHYYNYSEDDQSPTGVITQSVHINTCPIIVYPEVIVNGGNYTFAISFNDLNSDIKNALENNQLHIYCMHYECTLDSISSISGNSDIYHIICTDGYETILNEKDMVNIVTKNGIKQCVTLENLISGGTILDNLLYHVESKNSKYYGCGSAIKTIKRYNKWYLFKFPNSDMCQREWFITSLVFEMPNNIYYQTKIQFQKFDKEKGFCTKIVFL